MLCRSIFGTTTVSQKPEESPKAVRPVRSAMPTSQPSTSTASESQIVNNGMPPTSVRPSDLCYTGVKFLNVCILCQISTKRYLTVQDCLQLTTGDLKNR